ncbi:DUF4232 domain-containing protein [Kitasatospora kifunensis]|uniref:DUF4232 domain-containing protein n=1 Tax=Kitasatospora kifunensis TaxID=58351 RepID=A0A7W7W037_KITKI|nr:DUF4232 domain-containing protein [Kitasatospora kifunensis]MBB4928768.1 hypothetical protein [Kitasatospora kifunensis]
MRSRFLLTVSVSTLLAGLGLAACGSSSSSTASPPKAGVAAPVTGLSAAPVSTPPATGQPAAPVSAAPIAGQSAAPARATAPVSAAPTGATGATGSTGPGGSQTAKCRTQSLKWTLTRLTDASAGTRDPANAQLVAVNSGSDSCTLTGYPKLEFHLGKGPEALGVGQGSAAPVTLGAGKKAVIALRYSEFNGKGPDSANCVLVTAGSAEVAAPGDDTVVRVPVVDQGGKPAEITICGDEVRMSPPVAQ